MLMVLAAVFSQPSDLPIRRVVLYRSGVGYLERSGVVTGTTSITLTLREAQVNDLLKSLVMIDLDGGQILPIQYTPRDPLNRTLSSFVVDISDNPSQAQLLYRLRGLEVEFQLRRRSLRGQVMSVEPANRPDRGGWSRYDMRINLLRNGRLESLYLSEVQSFRVLDARIQQELESALRAIASGLDDRRRNIELRLQGTGQRRVLIGYLTEMPQWKMSYRLVISEGQPAILQGWAIVENTTDEDWNSVQLQLVSGRPISFTQNLYEPFYPARLRYTPPSEGALLPPLPQASLEQFQLEQRAQEPPRQIGEPPFLRRSESAGGFGGAAPDVVFGGMPAPRERPPAPGEAMTPEAVQRSVPEMARGQERGALFDYRVEQPVTIARQQSAMVPVINRSVAAETVTFYNAKNHQYHPFFGIRLKNTTGLTLISGPLTVYLNGAYGGDSYMQVTEPDNEQFLLYALDVGVEVNRRDPITIKRMVAVAVANGMLKRHYRESRTTVYEIKNRDGRPRQLVLEHPRDNEWQLAAPTTSERTADFYRFQLNLQPQQATTFEISEEKSLFEELSLLAVDNNQLVQLLASGEIEPRLREAFQRIVQMRTAMSETERQIQARNSRIRAITDDQARIRENMRALDRNSDLYKEYVATLSRQERELAQLRQQLEQLQATYDQQSKELRDYIQGLNL